MIHREEALQGARLFASLPRFLRRPIAPHDARSILQDRLQHRADRFLSLARNVFFRQPASVYRRLLALAGCEYGDLVGLVSREGVEGALGTLARRGVYLTVDELKGRRPIVRGPATIAARPDDMRDAAAAAHLSVHTGGSRGAATTVPIDLAYVRSRAVDTGLAVQALGGRDWAHAVWGVPGGANMVVLLECAAFGGWPARWFSQIDPRHPDLPARYRWSARAMRWSSIGAPTRLPAIEHAPLAEPTPILRWLDEMRRAGRTPHLHTHASSAVRLCQVAEAAGMRLDGVWLTAASEPITAARLATMHRTGATCWPQYATVEAGVVARGCTRASAPDDVHVFEDRLALVQVDPGDPPPGLTPGALLVTSLSRTATALLLLNVSLGDVAQVDRTPCGCPLEQVGWTLHLREVRSVEKLTAAGMTFLDTDVVRVLEEVLPARFGGGPTDYQLVEEETSDGRPGLRLLIHPRVGPIASDEVADAFLSAIGAARDASLVMGIAWRDAGLLRVERRAPLVTAAGKILHLHAGPARGDASRVSGSRV